MNHKQVVEAYYGLCKRVNSPVSLGCWIQFRDDPKGYANRSINPADYNDSLSFFRDYVCVNYLRKFEGLDTGYNLQDEAISRFDKAEEKCSLTNNRLFNCSNLRGLPASGFRILPKIQRNLEQLWGRPTFDELFAHCDWGPGATATLKGADANVESKMSELPLSVVPTSLPYLKQILRNDIAWNSHLMGVDVDGPVSLLGSYFRLTPSSRLLTVPKDAKTDRVICAEPSANIFMQKSLGRYLRARLQRFGIDLDDQTSNQELSRLAAREGLATIDLKAASDTISIECCRTLLPPDMFDILNCMRSPSYNYGDRRDIHFHKFSSMGNGFTFELESAIFWSVAMAVREHCSLSGPIGVYGDDIIIPGQMYDVFVSCIDDLGFEVNSEKSFSSGQFFESCGEHYFSGDRVTPVFQKRIVDCELEYIRFCNRLLDLATLERELGGNLFEAVWLRVFEARPKSVRNLVGFEWMEGDGFFRSPLGPQLRFCLHKGYLLHYAAPKKSKRVEVAGGGYSLALRKSAYGGSTDWFGYTYLRPRSRVKSFKPAKRWVPLSQKYPRTITERRLSRFSVDHSWVLPRFRNK